MFIRLLSAIILFNASAHAYGMIAQVVDSQNFCVFLPPEDATDRIISDSEWNANAFCMGNTPLATNAGKLPDGFITSAHYVKTDAYVQVTGMMDYTKANLVGTDEGGQMDIKAPTGSSCAGWDYYVNLIEPISNTYCMRCCNDTTNCNRGISEKGCAYIIPGDYSGPNSSSNSTTVAPSATTTAASSSTTTTDTVSSSSSSFSMTTITSSSAMTISTSSPAPSSSTTITSSSSSSSSSSPLASNSASASSDGTLTEQSSNAAYAMKPMTVAMGASILISTVAMLS
ncbi:uncharacterized protein B0P05DRAFT_634512 [Gilbertella persicaria]|uniref:uncharacterized protein n=1 Tax=Gilbertella persicaria TaxID=101096 RepID=UPI00221EF7B2|nr:uncharacterized protein B0P05DRAFT_634512 [Gilbertella persicaria]KAI8091406.1 hypothetical protein B0P05DRAFT_634512 [Gilbertella persicaria]